MAQPLITGTGIFFGNQALPNGQGTMAWQNLNDLASWFIQDFDLSETFRQIISAQQVFRAKGVYLSDDFGPREIILPYRYDETPGTRLGAALAVLEQAGEQYLTFDNKVTGILAKYKSCERRTMTRRWSPYLWDFELHFYARTPWFVDLASTSIASTNIVSSPVTAPTASALAGGALATGTYQLGYTYVTAAGETAVSPYSSNIVLSSGTQQISVSTVPGGLPSWATAVKWYFKTGDPTTGFTVQNNGNAFTLNTAGNGTAPPGSTPATTFSVTYNGSVFAEPVFTITLPGGNSQTITQLILLNQMSGEQLNIIPSGGWPNTLTSITIDCGAWTVKDNNGTQYDFSGSFPSLYGPVGQAQTFSVTITPNAYQTTSDGVAAISGSYINRWQI